MAVPFDEVLEALWILKDRAETAQRQSLQRVLASFDQVKQHLDALNVQEVQLRALISVNCVLEAVQDCDQEGGGVARLVDLSTLQVVFECLDSLDSPERLLVLAAIFADACQDVE